MIFKSDGKRVVLGDIEEELFFSSKKLKNLWGFKMLIFAEQRRVELMYLEAGRGTEDLKQRSNLKSNF